MEISYRVDDMDQLNALMEEARDFDCVVSGHESCPVFYMQQNIDEILKRAIAEEKKVKVNIPIIFEDYLEMFKKEASRLIETFPSVKLIINDWGMLSYLHARYPDKKFAVGLGISFSYADCPWNFHIVEGELDKYKNMLQVHNMALTGMIHTLSELGIDEIIMGHMDTLEESYKVINQHGLRVTVNKNVNIVTMSRACHTLRTLGKMDEKGKCKKYCENRTTLKGTHYYDMAMGIHAVISDGTKAIQPEMFSYANILFTRNQADTVKHSYVSSIIEDYRY